MNNESEVLDDIYLESDISDDEPELVDESQTSVSDEMSEDSLGDTQLGQHLGQLITDIRRDEETFQQRAAPRMPADDLPDPDPFDPSHFSLDKSFEAPASQPAAPSSMEGDWEGKTPESATAVESEDSSSPLDDDANLAIAQLVSEIESTLQRFTQAERFRADQLIAEKEAQVAEQYRKLRNLANKVAKQKEQIQEAKKELKAKLELADRLHIEFDGIRQVLNGKLGLLDQLEKEGEGAE